MPQDQKQFIEIVDHFRGAYTQGDTAIAKDAIRLQRAKAICAAIRTPVVQNWTGTVFKVSSNREGKGILELTLSTHMKVRNDSIADVDDHTLIDPKGPLFDQTVLLKKNQEVLFFGSFIPDSTDCFRETSMTLSESMDEPEFLFRFTDIAPVPYQIAPYQGTFPHGRLR